MEILLWQELPSRELLGKRRLKQTLALFANHYCSKITTVSSLKPAWYSIGPKRTALVPIRVGESCHCFLICFQHDLVQADNIRVLVIVSRLLDAPKETLFYPKKFC